MNDLFLIACIACAVTMLRDYFGSLRRALFLAVVRLVQLHRAFNIMIGVILITILNAVATIVSGPTRPTLSAIPTEPKRSHAADKDLEPSLPA